MTEAEVRIMLDQLFAAYPREAAPSRRLRETWAPFFAKVEPRDAMAAVHAIVQTSTFLPSLAEMLAGCKLARRERLIAAENETLRREGATWLMN